IPILTCLPRLSSDETASYIEHRLRMAGYEGKSIFTLDSLGRIAALSRGVPREINRLCFNCLSLAYASAKPVVDLDVLEEVAADLDLASRLRKTDEPQSQQHDKAAEPAPAIVQAAVAPSGTRENVKELAVLEPETPKSIAAPATTAAVTTAAPTPVVAPVVAVSPPAPVATPVVTTRPPAPVATPVATARPPSPVAAAAVRPRPWLPVAPRMVARPPSRPPASASQRQALAASQRPSVRRSIGPSLVYRWPS